MERRDYKPVSTKEDLGSHAGALLSAVVGHRQLRAGSAHSLRMTEMEAGRGM